MRLPICLIIFLTFSPLLILSAIPPHPRIIMTDSDFQRVANYISTDSTAKMYYQQVLNQGTAYLSTPPVTRGTGSDQLAEAREVLKRLYVLGSLYRLDKNVTWANRGVEEMLSVGAWTDWNPAHFLDVAEFTHAFAVGYDWLYPAINTSSRTFIVSAISNLGLQTGINEYKTNIWWWKDIYNWNIVCNGGLSIGALSVLEENTTTANTTLNYAKQGIGLAVNSYSPDGAWPEGPNYWGYASRYLGPTIAALRTAINDTWGLEQIQGVGSNVLFAIYSFGPEGTLFNWADTGETIEDYDYPPMFWFGRNYNHSVNAYFARQHVTSNIVEAQDLCFYDNAGTVNDLNAVPTDRAYTTRHVASFRSNWTTTATALSFKGGDNNYNHNHLDHGQFVFDSQSLRWSIDMGMDNYGLPGYFDTANQRWTYYRCNTQGHNTLLLDGLNQDIHAQSPIIVFNVSNPKTKFSILNMTNAYHNNSKSTQRGFALVFDHNQLIISDEFSTTAKNVTWSMHTRANITIVDNVTAKLYFPGKTQTMELKVLDSTSGANCANVKVSWVAVNLQPPQYSSAGINKVQVYAPGSTCTRLIVTLGSTLQTVKVNPLSEWNTLGPLAATSTTSTTENAGVCDWFPVVCSVSSSLVEIVMQFF